MCVLLCTVGHGMAMGVRRPGSFSGNDPSSVLSPRSEAGALGVYMVENVLGGSPGIKSYVVSATLLGGDGVISVISGLYYNVCH